MKFLRQLSIIASALGLLWVAAPAGAADADTQAEPLAKHVRSSLEEDAKCTRCHDETETAPVLSIYQTRHGVKADARTPTCQSCHGESAKHLGGDPNQKGRARPDIVYKKKAYSPNENRQLAETCLGCHDSGNRQHWSGSAHEREDLACTNCHQIHTPADRVLAKVTQPEVCFQCHKEQRAQTHRISTHPLDAGKMACTDCHNAHGSTGPKLMIRNTVNEVCFTCHDEKRGPFLWEHQPVSDDCMNCHTPHGSTSQPLLKARMPWLCQECHSGDHARTMYSGASLAGGNVISVDGTKPFQNQGPAAQIVGRQCLNCHSLVHGSNSPAGAKFQR